MLTCSHASGSVCMCVYVCVCICVCVLTSSISSQLEWHLPLYLLPVKGVCVCVCVWQGGGRPQTGSRCRCMCVRKCVPPSCLDLSFITLVFSSLCSALGIFCFPSFPLRWRLTLLALVRFLLLVPAPFMTIHFNNFWALLSRPCASPVAWRRKKVCSSYEAWSFSSTGRSASFDDDKVFIR